MAATPAASATAIERALARIAVRPPYFDLRDVEERGPGSVAATVPLALPTGDEVGSIAADQAARHMAILGSCAAALSRDDDAPHHYLAVQAHYVRCSAAPSRADSELLRAEAVASWSDRRSARSLVKLATEDGRALNMLDVTFAVVTPRMFARFNQPVEPSVAAASAGTSALGLAPVEITEGGVRRDCGIIDARSCEGHFPGFPAAPVAVVMGQLCRTAGEALARHVGKPVRYRIEEGHVSASKLAAAGQRLVLDARYDRRDGDRHILRGEASADGETVGEVEVIMSLAHENQPGSGRC